jgi:hypothetical protein
MTVGFLQGRSDYEIEPLARLDYVELGFKPNSPIELRGDRLESVKHVAPFVAPSGCHMHIESQTKDFSINQNLTLHISST